MTSILFRCERGQAVVEFAIISTVLLMMTAGLIGVGQAFYENNAVSAAARYGARWGGVVGGTCQEGGSGSDWCSQIGGQTVGFWDQPGNLPAQSVGASCPLDDKSAASPSPYYTASSFQSSGSTNIVGAMVQRFDSNSSSSNSVSGSLAPGFDLSKLKVCIQLPSVTQGNVTEWDPAPGNPVQVFVYYRFTPVGGLLTKSSILLVSSARYIIQ